MASSNEIIEIIVVSMRDAFLAVTVFVAAMVLLFSWLQYIADEVGNSPNHFLLLYQDLRILL